MSNENKSDFVDLYAGVMSMLNKGKVGYTNEGLNEDGYPIFKCKDDSHSFSLVILDFGTNSKKMTNEN